MGLVLLLVLVLPTDAHAQQLTVVVGREPIAASGVFQVSEPDTCFRKREIIHVGFNLDGPIDSISTFEGKDFTVLGGPVQGLMHQWKDGEHTMAAYRSFRIKALRRGGLVLPSVTIYSGGKAYRSAPVEVRVKR